MTQAPDAKHIHYDRPFYELWVQPKGYLTLDLRSHACMHYVLHAAKARHIAGKGSDSQIIQYEVGGEVPDWMESRDVEIARSTAIIYGLESPDEFLKFKKEAWAQAVAIGITAESATAILEVTPDGDRNKVR